MRADDEPVSAVQPGKAESARFYSFQLGSFPDKETALLMYEQIKELPRARIEKIGKYYTARIGFWKSRQPAEALRAAARRIAPDAFLRTADLTQGRILIPSAHFARQQKDDVATTPAAQPMTGDRVQDFLTHQDRDDLLSVNLRHTPLSGVLGVICPLEVVPVGMLGEA